MQLLRVITITQTPSSSQSWPILHSPCCCSSISSPISLVTGSSTEPLGSFWLQSKLISLTADLRQ
ncbi:hypothetical protein V6Z12_D01G229000 [Gossypium hirsutum]